MKLEQLHQASRQDIRGAAPKSWLSGGDFRRSPSTFAGNFSRPVLLVLLGILVAFTPLATHADPAGLALSGHVPQAVSNGQAAFIGRLPATQRLNLAIGLPLRDQAGLETFLNEVNDPGSPNYHKFLTVQEFTDRFAPTQADYQAVVNFALANGLTVTDTPANRLVVNVEGSVANIEQAFQTTIGLYQHPTEKRTFRAPSSEPIIPAGLPVLHVSGMDDFVRPRPVDINLASLGSVTPETSYTGSGPNGLFIGNDFRAAYAPGVALTGSGQTVALLEFEAYNLSDVQAYFAQAGLPLNVPVNNVLLDGATGILDSSSDDIEAVLDIDMAINLAPALAQVLVYEGNGNNFIPIDVMNRIATDNIAKQISCSWLWTYDPNETEVFMEFAAQGQTLLTASGDYGAYDITYNGTDYVSFPAEDAFVTAVGGTSLTTNGAGGPWQSEVCWSVLSGGGISPDNIPIPSYQQGVINSANKGSTTLRNVPDVAANADQNIYLTYTYQGSVQAGAIGGTSAAAPLWAGFIALANQQAAQNGSTPVGFLNPAVYAIGKGSNYAKDFHDITVGSNVDIINDYNFTNYDAVPGYDLVTGWGSPTGQSLIDALVGTSASTPDFNLWSSLENITVVRGSNATATITITPFFGFAGSVSLSVSGLPSGVTASFSPSSTTGASTLTLSATSSATTGTSTISVTGKSGGLTHTTTISLTVPSKSPSFSLSLSESKMDTYRGDNPGNEDDWTLISLSKLYGFTGTVDLTVSGLPSGVTGALSSTTATGTAPWSFLYLTADNTVTPGTYKVTITGKSGSLTNTTTLTLTVLPPDFLIYVVPSSLSMMPKGNASAAIDIGDANGFTANIVYSASGLPSGVTASFSPSSTNANSVMFTASSKATAGTYTVTLTGKSPGLTHSVPLTLVVEPTISTTSVTTTAGGPWQNTAIPTQTGTFTVTYDVVVPDSSSNPYINAEVGLSNGAQTADSGFAVITRLNSSGFIDAISGGSYVKSKITYFSGATFHFRVVVNLSKHTYSAYVAEPILGNSAEQTIGTNLGFSTKQKSVTKLNSWGASSPVGSETVTNFGY